MAERDERCIFCRIAAGDAPCHLVLREPLAFAIMDIRPASRGHVLVIPVRHCETIFDIDEASHRAVATAARRVALAIRAELAPDGLGVVQANGAAAGQTVAHYHVHLLPRTEGVRLRLHGAEPGDPAELEALARALSGRL